MHSPMYGKVCVFDVIVGKLSEEAIKSDDPGTLGYQVHCGYNFRKKMDIVYQLATIIMLIIFYIRPSFLDSSFYGSVR